MTAPVPAGHGTDTRKRPVLVTLAVVLVYLSGLSSVALGVLVLLSRYDVTGDSAVVSVSLLGAGVILFGLLTIGVGSGISRGSRLARLSITVFVAALIVLNIVTIVTTDGWDWTAIIELVLEGFLVAVLWIPPGSRHFRVSVPAVSSPTS